MRFSKILAAAVLVASFATASAQADIIAGPAGSEGSSNNSYPFNIGAFGLTAQRFEQFYAASDFGASPIVISGLQFRPDASAGGAFSTILSNITIKLGTINGPLTNNFNANEAALMTTVFSGPLSLSSAFTGPANGPKDFDISIIFGTNFSYDPSLGGLLLEVQNFGGGTTTAFDSFAGDPNTRDYGTDDNANSSSGTTDNANLVTKFVTSTTSVPEPLTISLFGAGAAGLAAMRRRKKTNQV